MNFERSPSLIRPKRPPPQGKFPSPSFPSSYAAHMFQINPPEVVKINDRIDSNRADVTYTRNKRNWIESDLAAATKGRRIPALSRAPSRALYFFSKISPLSLEEENERKRESCTRAVAPYLQIQGTLALVTINAWTPPDTRVTRHRRTTWRRRTTKKTREKGVTPSGGGVVCAEAAVFTLNFIAFRPNACGWVSLELNHPSHPFREARLSVVVDQLGCGWRRGTLEGATEGRAEERSFPPTMDAKELAATCLRARTARYLEVRPFERAGRWAISPERIRISSEFRSFDR